MGLLSLFAKPATEASLRLPSGSFTVDREGRVLCSTLPQAFAEALVTDITRSVLNLFKSAQTANLPLFEFTVTYSSLKLTAREMRGGAIIYLTPQNLAGVSG